MIEAYIGGEYIGEKSIEGNENLSDIKLVKKRYNKMLNHVEDVEQMIKEMQPYITDKVKISFDEWNVWESWYRESGVAEAIYAAKLLNMMM